MKYGSVKQPADAEVPALGELALLNGLLEHRVRLAACVLLSKHDAMSFSGLKQVLGETDGSLGAHLRKLEESRYLAVEKTYRNRRPVTWYRLSERGRTSLKRHLAALTRLIDQAV